MAAGFKTATVNASDVPSTQTNFPSYVDLSRLGITTLAEAQSVRVYADSGKTTEWAREIVSATEMHVKVPSLTSTTDIYVDYDGVRADYAAGDTYGRNAVWSGHRAVYHLESLTFDYSGNGYSLTDTNSVFSSSGKLGNNADFGSANVNKKLNAASTLGTTTNGAKSFSFWVNVTTAPTSGNVQDFVAIGYSDLDVFYGVEYWNASGTLKFRAGRAKYGATDPSLLYNVTLTTGSWFHVAYTFNTSYGQSLYLNGSSVVSDTAVTGNGANGQPTNTALGVSSWANVRYTSGLLDEVKFTSSELSANWIATEYNNQSDEPGFWGTWTDVGGGPAPAAFIPKIQYL